MRHRLLAALLALAAPLASASAQLHIEFSLPGVEIGVRQPSFPRLVLVPGYPVYYDPSAETNYFFYDGLYWVYERDSWYASSWYDGPWGLVEPEYVPVFILRVPVSYYRRPPAYFQGWQREAPPRWGEHWGRDWDRQRSGWDRWDRRRAPGPAPLPIYQRQYAGDRYPRADQQQTLRRDHYQYAPRDAAVKAIVRSPAPPRAAPPRPAPPGERRDRLDRQERRDQARPADQLPQRESRERGQPQAPPPRREPDRAAPPQPRPPQAQPPEHARQEQQHAAPPAQAPAQPRARSGDGGADGQQGRREDDRARGRGRGEQDDRKDKKDRDGRHDD